MDLRSLLRDDFRGSIRECEIVNPGWPSFEEREAGREVHIVGRDAEQVAELEYWQIGFLLECPRVGFGSKARQLLVSLLHPESHSLLAQGSRVPSALSSSSLYLPYFDQQPSLSSAHKY